MLVHIDRHTIAQRLKCSYMGIWDILELSYFIKNVKVKGDDFIITITKTSALLVEEFNTR